MPQLTLPLNEAANTPAPAFSITNVFPPLPGVGSGSIAVLGTSTGGIGVQGQSSDPLNASAAVAGFNTGNGPGVYGSATANDAVVGYSSSNANAGVAGHNTSTGSAGGVGVYGTGGAYAGKFDGNVLVNGTLSVTIDIVLTGGDCAEEFDIESSAQVEAGTVMVLGEGGALQPSATAYSRMVAGVISGAGEYKPGLILDRKRSSQGRLPIALVGKVYCKVDADHGAIEIGDLLTSSLTPGHAMKASDPSQAFGAVLGKALRALKSGQSLIPILVALQ
jgi:hypothetical protein